MQTAHDTRSPLDPALLRSEGTQGTAGPVCDSRRRHFPGQQALRVPWGEKGCGPVQGLNPSEPGAGVEKADK